LSLDFLYATGIPTGGGPGAQAVAVDSSGDAYVTGGFSGSVDFGGTSLTSQGKNDIFIAKYSPTGSLIWAKDLAGTSSTATGVGNGIAVDSKGNAYVTGTFSGMVDFDPNGGEQLESAPSTESMFLAAYDPSGTFIFAKSPSFSGTSEGKAVSIDPTTGNVYLEGTFFGMINLTFGNPTNSFILKSSGTTREIFAMQAEAGDGVAGWADDFGSNNTGTNNPNNVDERAGGIAADGQGHVYMTGSYQGTADFNPASAATPYNVTSNGDYDGVAVQLDTDGNMNWAFTLGGGGADFATGLAADSAGNADFTGTYSSGISVGDFSLSPTSTAGNPNGYVTQYAPNGNPNWLRQVGISANTISTNGIATDSTGDVLTVGTFQGTGNFNPASGAAQNLTSQGTANVFVQELDSKGNLLAAQSGGSTSGSDTANAIGVSQSTTANPNVAVVGQTAPPSTFGGWSLSGTGSESFVSGLGTPTQEPAGFSTTTYSVNGNGGQVTITVSRPAGGQAGSVQYATSDGTAKAGTDYTTSTGTLNFAAGDTAKSFTVPIINDTSATSDTTFQVNLSNFSGGVLPGTPSSATVTIHPASSLPQPAQFSSTSYSVGGGAGSLTVLVDRPGGGPAGSVQYATSNGTAQSGTDYTTTTGTLNFGSGSTQEAITVPILNNKSATGITTFQIALSNFSGGVSQGTPTTATVTIIPTQAGTNQAAFSQTAYGVNEKAGTVTITVIRPFGGAAGTVHYATSDASAAAGTDYTNTAGTLSFPAGATSETFIVPILNRTDTGTRTVSFNVALTNFTGGLTAGTPTSATVNIAQGEFVYGDFDGDGKTDPAVFEPSTATFYISGSKVGNEAIQFGIGTLFGGHPVNVSNDYDGDGIMDPAVFEPSTSTFYIHEANGNVAIQFGQGTLFGGHPIPVPGNYEGDGKIDPAVFEPSTSTFYIARHNAPNEAVQFGQGTLFGGNPTPIPDNYEGDGKTDPAVFEPSTATFYIARHAAPNEAIQFGQGTDFGGHPVVVPGNYEGDGKTDPAVFEPSTATFYIARHNAPNEAIQFGQGTNFGGHPIVVPGNYEGDGQTDPAVFEPSTSTFYIARHTLPNEAVQFGQGTNFGGHPIAVPADFEGDGKLDPAVFEPSTSTFYIARHNAPNEAVQFGQGTNFGGHPVPISAPLSRSYALNPTNPQAQGIVVPQASVTTPQAFVTTTTNSRNRHRVRDLALEALFGA
jgi:hypothetical protein